MVNQGTFGKVNEIKNLILILTVLKKCSLTLRSPFLLVFFFFLIYFRMASTMHFWASLLFCFSYCQGAERNSTINVHAVSPSDGAQSVEKNLSDLHTVSPSDGAQSVEKNLFGLHTVSPSDGAQSVEKNLFGLHTVSPSDGVQSIKKNSSDVHTVSPSDGAQSVEKNLFGLHTVSPSDGAQSVEKNLFGLHTVSPSDGVQSIKKNSSDVHAVSASGLGYGDGRDSSKENVDISSVPTGSDLIFSKNQSNFYSNSSKTFVGQLSSDLFRVQINSNASSAVLQSASGVQPSDEESETVAQCQNSFT